MSKIDLWRSGAAQMRKDPDPRWHAVADWLDLEAACQGEMEPFAELMNAAIEKTSGVKGYLRFVRKPNGDINLRVDTDEGATAVAQAYLNDQNDVDPTDALFEKAEALLSSKHPFEHLRDERKREVVDVIRELTRLRRLSKDPSLRKLATTAIEELGEWAFALITAPRRVTRDA